MGGGAGKAKDANRGLNDEEAEAAQKAFQMVEKLHLESEDLKSLVRSVIASNQDARAAPARRGPRKVAMLTAGGLAPCLSASVGALIQRYTDVLPDVQIICYVGGYKGLLLGQSIDVTRDARRAATDLYLHGGSPIGNSRVKLTNVKDCLKRGLVKEGQDPQQVAADQLVKDGVDVLHTIGGDDTNLAAAELAAFLKKNSYELIVIGLPKTIDNDVFPIRQTLGAWTAAEEGAKFFANVVNEQSSSHRMLILHEVMGRDCGYLTAATARNYRDSLKRRATVPSLGLHPQKLDVHAVYIPEIAIDIEAEAARLTQIMDLYGVVNIFISEGAGVKDIVKEMESRGEEVPRDAFGHVKLDKVNPGQWFASRFSEMVKAQRTMVQKSGYFSRAAPCNHSDLDLIKSCCDHAVDCALRGKPGVIGHDEDNGNRLRNIEFERVKGGKPFDVSQAWFVDMMKEVNAPPKLDEPPATILEMGDWTPGFKTPKKVAILTAGGLAPCLSSAVGGLIERYNELCPNVQILCYKNGFRGLLTGSSFLVSAEARRQAGILHMHGGSAIGSSRVKISDTAGCVRRGLVQEGQDPLQVAVEQLVKDGVEVLHPIGGDTVGAELAGYLKKSSVEIALIGLPKTIDNDVQPIKQTLGAWTAAEQAAKYFANVVYESSANPRMLIVHEVMGANCGYLTAAAAEIYRGIVIGRGDCSSLGVKVQHYDVHAVFIPEMKIDIQAEAARLREVMSTNDCVNIFISEGAGIDEIAVELESKGKALPRDDKGKVNFEAVKPGEWFAGQFAAMIGAEKVLVQKSGYYARSAAANAEDLRLIKSCTDHAVECALRGESGIVGHDEEQHGILRAVEFERIKGCKPFNVKQAWFQNLLNQIGQKMEYGATAHRVFDVSEEDVGNLKVRMNVATTKNNNAFFR